MDNSKYVDLHKIAAIFRGIQEEEYAKNNEEVAELDNAMEDAVEEDNAFNTAAAKAALAGEKEFSFNGKKYPVKMSKEDAKKLMDDAVNSEEPVVEEPAVEDKDAEEVLKKGMEDELADTIKDKIEDDEESTDEAKMDAHSADMEKHIPMISKMKKELMDKGMKPEDAFDKACDKYGFDPDDVGEYMDKKNEATEVSEDSHIDAGALEAWYKKFNSYQSADAYDLADGFFKYHLDSGVPLDAIEKNEYQAILKKYGEDAVFDEGPLAFALRKDKEIAPITNALHSEFNKIVPDHDDIEKASDMIHMESKGEQVAVMSTDTLSQILKLAGMKQVSDADINQPEGEAEQVEEYSNSPEEEYADTDFMTNKLAGGVNRPKKFPNVGNQGHNDLVQRLTKAYNEQKD